MRQLWLKIIGQDGSLMVGAVVLVVIMTLVGVAIFDLTVVESKLVGNSERDARAVRVAEAGIFKALRDLSDGNGDGSGGVCNLPPSRGTCIDFASIVAEARPITFYTNQAFAGGTFTVVGTPVSVSLI